MGRSVTAVRRPLGVTVTLVRSGIPRYSDEAITATIAYCKYVHERYGRFPVNGGPFRTLLAYQAHRLDPDFYAAFYKEGVLPAAVAHGD